MSIAIVTVDRAALPTALLPLAKSHLRVDGNYDDAYITNAMTRAIAKIEAANDATINPTTVVWTPASTEFCDDIATLPVRPVIDFTAVAGSPPVDVSDDYSVALKWDGIHGIPIQILQGAAATGLSVTLELGFADQDELPPQLLDMILSHTGHLFEHREILSADKDYVAPELQDFTWWMPRA